LKLSHYSPARIWKVFAFLITIFLLIKHKERFLFFQPLSPEVLKMSIKTQIALFYLHAYSPDLNPDEYLNNDFKRNVNKENIPINKKELAVNTENFMSMLSENPTRVANYFKHEKIAYAAA